MPEDDRTFITVHDGMPEHPKIVGLSDAAFRKMIELWCYSSRNRADGVIPRAEWMKARPKVRKELTESVPGWRPLFIDLGGRGVEVHDYLRHQRSAEQIAVVSEQKKRAGAKGNHDRWHVGPKGRPQPDCPLCPAGPSPNPPSSRKGSQPRSQNGSHVGSQNGSQIDRETSPDPEEFLRNSQTDPETDLRAGCFSGGGSRAVGDGRRPDPPKAERPQDRSSPCGLHPDDDRKCRRCRDKRLADEQAVRDQHREAVVASLPERRCPMCDAKGWLHEVGSARPVSPPARCDHDTDHELQVARATEAS